ncbi:MAG: hypothetical protein ACOYMQ_03020 [Pseudanabaena sp.]|jgi:hypothetical protein
MVKELDRVVLADRMDESDLELGDIFLTLTGETVAVVSYCDRIFRTITLAID